MSYRHVIVTRFSFRFRRDALVDKLLAPERLDNRMRIFEQYCYPAIINQDTKKFYWILVIDPLLPQKYRDYLKNLIVKHKSSANYATQGPRDIFLHEWNWDTDKLERIDWIMNYFAHKEKPVYLITTRLDDDDALIKNFISTIQSHVKEKDPKKQIKNFLYLSYCVGYQYYVGKHTLRVAKNPMIALGLSLITKIDKYPMCVYLGNHTKIPSYLKDPEKHDRMLELYKKNDHLPATPQQVQRRLKVIANGDPMWIRTVHGFNLQKNLKRQQYKQKNPQIDRKINDILKKRFNLEMDVRN